MEVWGLTDTGNVREQNQDAYRIEHLGENALLAVVCDGMGGARSGNVASRLASEVFSEEVKRSFSAEHTPQEAERMLRSAASLANIAVFEQSQLSEEYSGMGTTLVAGLVYQDQLFCVNIGDSRLYIITEFEVRQITHDHSFVQYLLDYGKITPEEARNYPRKNVITQAVGINPSAEADFFCVKLRDWGSGYLLLCSDGLSNFVDSKHMLEVLYSAPKGADGKTDLDAAASKLIELANAGGGTDNITAVLAQF